MLGLNPWVLLGLVLAWLASVATSGWLGYDYATGKSAQERLTMERLAATIRASNQEATDALGTKLEERLGKLRIVNTTINQEVRHEREIQTRVLDNPDCALPPSTVRLLNNARGYGQDGPGTSEPAK